MKVLGAGVAAATSGMAALGAAAINSYADFEQLKGGIETLFGARGAQTVEEYAELVGGTVSEVQDEFNMLMEAQSKAMSDANDAYKTAGMSANEYMETVSSFAASLKQSTENELEAAEAANLAVIDMADNASKMGTSMESIQNAYQGFAKQNYTMLDNLKLGYGGTNEEMERLLQDATALSGVEYDINSLADVYAAIHTIQDELGITGTTAKEASETISGSVSAMSSAWSNLVTGVADDNANFDQLVDNFVDSVGIVAENILPRVEVALEGIGDLVEELFPIIMEKIPEIVDSVLPDLLQSGISMLLTIGQGILDTLPTLAEIAFDLIMQLISSITDNAGSVFESGSEILREFISGIAEVIPDLMNSIVEMVISLAMAITDPDVLTNIIEAGIDLLLALTGGLVDAVPNLLDAVPKIIGNLVTTLIANAPRLLVAAIELLVQLGAFLVQNIWQLLTFIPDIVDGIIDAFAETDWGSIGQNLIDGIWGGLQAGWDWLVGKVKKLANSLFGAAQDELDIHSPSRKFKWLGEMCIAGLDEPIEDYNPYETLQHSMKANISGLQTAFASNAFVTSGGTSMDYAAMGSEFKGAINGLGVYMSGEKVGHIVSPTVNMDFAKYDTRRI